MILSWSYPSMTTAGKTFTGVRRVVLYRTTEETFAPQQPVLPPQQFTKLRERVDSIEGANLSSATAGARLTYEDTPPFHTKDGHAIRYTYAVVTEGTAARSDLSNLASIVPLDVAVPPANVTATPKAAGVDLSWTAPTASVTKDAKPVIVGYNVYRVNAATPDELPNPANATPVTGTTYTDAPPYGTHQYRITAVAAAGPPRIESDPSAVVSATFKDLTPPPAPTGLTALVETKAVRLVWDPVDAADLAGYRVYRSEGTGTDQLKVVGRIPITPAPVTQTNFRDTSIQQGISYFYEVTAVDKNGNESPAAKTNWVLAPKTP